LQRATVDECRLVIDWCLAVKAAEQPGFVEHYLDTSTPWKPLRFDTYLARARKWHARGRPPARPRPAGGGTGVPGYSGVLSNPRTAANVAGLQRAAHRLQAQWAQEGAGHGA
jgi:hypothetical protein